MKLATFIAPGAAPFGAGLLTPPLARPQVSSSMESGSGQETARESRRGRETRAEQNLSKESSRATIPPLSLTLSPAAGARGLLFGALGFLALMDGAIRVAPAYAQFGAVLVKGAVAEEEAEGEEEDAEDAEEMQGRGAAGNAVVGRVRAQRLQPEVFDQWVFNGTNAQETRNRMNSLLTMRISDIDRVSPLSQDQSQKLQLAGKLDIKRVFDQVEAGRRRFEVSNRANQGNAALIHRDVQPLRQLLAKEAFTEGSVFDKAVRGLLSSDQLPQYRKLLDDRKTYRQRALRETILLTLDKQIPLREEQRKKLRELLDESRPVNPGQFESHAMWFVASKLPDEKYRAILTDPQWNLLKARFAQVQGLEQFLIQNGALGDVEEAKPAAGGF